MTDRKPKRPRDPSQLAKMVVDIATGQVEETELDSPAHEFARRGGKKGGKARAESLTPERRREIAKKAAAARWRQE